MLSSTSLVLSCHPSVHKKSLQARAKARAIAKLPIASEGTQRPTWAHKGLCIPPHFPLSLRPLTKHFRITPISGLHLQWCLSLPDRDMHIPMCKYALDCTLERPNARPFKASPKHLYFTRTHQRTPAEHLSKICIGEPPACHSLRPHIQTNCRPSIDHSHFQSLHMRQALRACDFLYASGLDH